METKTFEKLSTPYFFHSWRFDYFTWLERLEALSSKRKNDNGHKEFHGHFQ